MRDGHDLGNAPPTRAFAKLGPYLTSYVRCASRSRKRKICAAFVTHGSREAPRLVWDPSAVSWLFANGSSVEDNICAAFLENGQRDGERSSVQHYGARHFRPSHIVVLTKRLMHGHNPPNPYHPLKNLLRILLIASQSLLGLAAGLYATEPKAGHQHHAHAAALTDAQKQLLSGYDTVRAALASDDLAAAKSAAAAITDSAPSAHLANAQSLAVARITFKKLSNQAVQLAKDHAGYYVAHCPMAGGDWVQTTTKISNPYLGKQMADCGSIKD